LKSSKYKKKVVGPRPPATAFGWMIAAVHSNTSSIGLPAGQDVFENVNIDRPHGLPTLCGIWVRETEALEVLGKLMPEARVMFRVVPVKVVEIKEF